MFLDDDLKTFDDFLDELAESNEDNSQSKREKREHDESKKLKVLKLIKDIKEDIQIWYNHLFIFVIYYNIKSGFKNFWVYRKVIWNDRWYDYQYIFNIIEFKLKDTIKNWEGAHYVGAHFTKLRMQVLLNRIEEYQTNLDNLQELLYQKKIDKKEYKELKDKLLNKTWKSLGRNITRFWD